MTTTKTLNFLNETHKERYFYLLEMSRYSSDIERQSLFFIVAGNGELYSYVNQIYDFESETLKITTRFGKLSAMCESSKALLKLAIQFYNGVDNKQSVYDTFIFLDSANKMLAVSAICLCFNI